MAPLKFIKTKLPLTIEAPISGQEVEYPSEFFKGKKKPTLIVPRIYRNKDSARDAFASSMIRSKPDLDAGKEFVFLFLQELKETNPDRWMSFGVLIGERDEEVNVFTLFDVKFKDGVPPLDSETGTNYEGAEMGLLVMFCGIYRMSTITDSNYLTQVSDRIMSQAVDIPDSVPQPSTLVSLVGSWLSDLNYLKMIAGIDMFIHRFSKCPFVHARVGTISSRYRDCASLLSVRYFLNMIGSKNLDDSGAWITYEPVALDLIQMSKTGEEAGEGQSYFPYQTDLGLVRKSAYSTVANPSYFFFVHGVGALLGLERSRNARMNLEYGTTGTVANVYLVAYIHKRNHVQKLQFTPTGEPIIIEGENTDTESDGLTIRSNSPVKWAKFMSSRNWIFTEFMKETIQGMKMELIESDTRSGSIGEFLSKHSID